MLGTCEAVGEIDLETAPALEAAIRLAIDFADTRTVTVDCSAITFMDSSGFHALVSAHRYADSHSRQLAIVNVKPICARVLRLCDRDNELDLAVRAEG